MVEKTTFVTALKSISHLFCENKMKFLKNTESMDRTSEF